jgi:hypothetical protein
VSEPALQLSEERLASLIDKAAERGAKRALESVGLHDDDAVNDVRDLRNLLDSFRQVKRGAMQQVGRMVTLAILAAMVFAAGLHWPGR